MATTYIDQFFVMDPGNPPAYGTALSVAKYNIVDQNDDNWVSTGVGDTVDGLTVTSVWVGDKITVMMGGVSKTITGVTFYRSGGAAVFTPTDGTVLDNATFVSSTYVTSSTQTPVGNFGPPCLVAGTMVLTPEGEKPVEMLRLGDRVMTRDCGAQPIRWIGARSVVGNAEFAPVRFAPGAIGNTRALHVSPQHRILMTGWRAELLLRHERGSGRRRASAEWPERDPRALRRGQLFPSDVRQPPDHRVGWRGNGKLFPRRRHSGRRP